MESEFIERWLAKGNAGHISPLFECQTEEATHLCIYDITDKLKNNGYYDIGGTYTNNQKSEFWFYYTTAMSHGYNVLLNLFVLPRNPACFTLTIPKSKQLSGKITSNESTVIICYGPEKQLTFTTSQKDEHVYVKTYQFDANDISRTKDSMLLVPIAIKVHPKTQLDQDVIRSIKLNHNLSSLMYDNKSADLFLESSSKKKYPVHKILLAAHSPILRSMLSKNADKVLPLDVADDVIKFMIEFIYTGNIANMYKQNGLTLLNTAKTFELKCLYALVQNMLGDQINVQNAVDFALDAKKYKLEMLTAKVFDFIKNNPEVISSEGWQKLEDVQLIKELLKHIHPKGNCSMRPRSPNGALF